MSDREQVGINPGVHSARHKRHYAGPNNAFCMCTWIAYTPSVSRCHELADNMSSLSHAATRTGPLLYESGLVTERLTHAEDARCLEWSIGLTNIVSRSSPSMQDLSKCVVVSQLQSRWQQSVSPSCISTAL